MPSCRLNYIFFHLPNHIDDRMYTTNITIWRALALAFIIYNSSFFTNSTQAQNLDSLWNIWQDETQPDTTRLIAIGNFAGDGYLYSKPDSAFYFAQLQYDYAKSNGLKKYMASALSMQGSSFYFRGNYPKALEYYKKSLAKWDELNNKKGIASALNNIGNIYNVKGNYPKALEYYKKSLAIKEKQGNKKGIASSQNNIGTIYFRQGNYSLAMAYYQKSLVNYQELDDKKGIASLQENVGSIYDQQDNYSLANEYYQKGLVIYEELGNKQGVANIFYRIGTLNIEQGKYSKGMEYLQESLARNEEMGSKVEIASLLISLGRLNGRQGNYPKGADYCQRGLELAQSIDVLEQQKNACKCLYDNYKAMGNGNEALKYMEMMRVVEDSINKEETSKQLQRMEFDKQVFQDSLVMAEKERLVEEAHKEDLRKKTQNRNIAYGIGGLVLLLASGLYSRLRYVRKSKSALQVEKDRSENLLLNILPEEIAQELKEKGKSDARDFDMVSILFTDFKGFTEQSSKLSAADLVNEINHCFEAFDGIMEKYSIEKIKTIGDAYMAAGGLPVPTDDSVKNTVLAALEMQEFIVRRLQSKVQRSEPAFEMRVGIHTGPVVAGIVGVKKFQYDIWGDTVNTASRMESSGEVGKVNISKSTYGLLKDDAEFAFESRGWIKVKGKGEMEMWFVSRSS